MDVLKIFALKAAIILTFVASLTIAMHNTMYLWFLFLLVLSFFADIARIGAVASAGKRIMEERRQEETNGNPDE